MTVEIGICEPGCTCKFCLDEKIKAANDRSAANKKIPPGFEPDDGNPFAGYAEKAEDAI